MPLSIFLRGNPPNGMFFFSISFISHATSILHFFFFLCVHLLNLLARLCPLKVTPSVAT